jgi:NhaP-type Na+/H+ or K+/H+ antiporter
MSLTLVFGVTLLLAVLVSGFAARTVLSTALLFLAAGAITGTGGIGWIDIKPNDPVVVTLADLALFSVLYTDGMRAGLPELRATGRTAGRALGLGMPLTFVGIALLTKAFTPLDWTASFLVGAILSPTDPVFAAAIIGRTDVPLRLRRLLNVESGLNDGLALPVVVHLLTLLPGVGSEARLAPLGPFSLAVILYATCHLTHANPYLAAFAAGSTLATVSPQAHDVFEQFCDLIAELLKLAALLVFGALLTPHLLHRVPIGAWAVAVLALVLVRPVAWW